MKRKHGRQPVTKLPSVSSGVVQKLQKYPPEALVVYVRCILAHALGSNFSVVSVRGGNFIRVSNLEMYDFRNILK